MKNTIIPLFIAVFLFSNAVSAEPAAGQLLNGDFESWTVGVLDDWSILGSGTVEDETTEKYEASHSAKVTISASSQVILSQYLVGFTEGVTLSGVVYVLDNNAEVDIHFGVIWYDVIDGTIKQASGEDTSVDNANWQQLSFS